jgi:hypothetical protein
MMQIRFSAFLAGPFPNSLPATGEKTSKSPDIQSKTKNHFILCFCKISAAISRSRSNIAHCLTDASGSRNQGKQIKHKTS